MTTSPGSAAGPMTIPALLAAASARHGDHPAVVGPDGERLTYAALAAEARTFAAALVGAGIAPRDRVALWAPNSVRWIVAVLGLWEAGATLVPVNTRFKGREAADIVSRTGARALITVTDLLGADPLALLAGSGVELPALTTTVVVAGPVPDGAVGWDDLVARPTEGDRDEAARRAGATTPDDVADILFTSGTTGVPKGVVQTHARTLRVAADWVAMTGLTADDRYLMVNPYFHMFGLKAGILAAVTAGATMVPEPVFDVDRVLARVGAEAITVLPGPPTLYQSLLDHPGRADHDLASLRVAVTGAADIPVELIRRIDRELPFSTIITGYGLTEGGTAVATGPDDDAETIATTVGRPRPGFEVRIVDGDADVPTGEAGEIWLRGPSVLAHYLDDPEATAAALTADGWLRTGDLGVLDEDGCLRIVGRSKDMFIVGGFNAYPAEIENALLRHPDVAQAAVIGVPDDRLGEVGMAFVVPRPGAAPLPDEVVAWSRGQMANYKAPRVVEVVDALPVNATGKVVKDELRARVARPAALHDGLVAGAARTPDRVALRAGEQTWTYADLDRRSNAFARHLLGAGVVAGDRVAVMTTNRPELLVAVLALSKVGAAAVLLSPAWKEAEVRPAIALTEPVHAVADGPAAELLATVLGPAAITDLDDAAVLAAALDRSDEPVRPFAHTSPTDESVLVFSSGTTGLPKAVRHTHASLGRATRHWVDALGLGPDDRFQVATPPSHILGLLNLLAALEAGASVRLHLRFAIDEVLRVIDEEALTLEMAVAPIALALAGHPDLERYDLSSLRYIMWGATPVTPSVAEDVTARTGVRWLPAYGASELPVLACNPVDEPDRWRLDSAGLPPPDVTLRVVDLDSGAELPPGEVGEIQARSPSLMAGYLPAEATAEVMVDGWYRTGDVGWIEPEGWVHLTDRSKEMIKVSGFQVAPAEIEAVLHGHPDVVDCAVFAVPDARAGEVPVAAVQLADGATVTPDELRDLVARTLATYKRLHHLVLVDAVPRLPSGKVLRRTLRDEWAPRLAAHEAPG